MQKAAEDFSCKRCSGDLDDSESEIEKFGNSGEHSVVILEQCKPIAVIFAHTGTCSR